MANHKLQKLNYRVLYCTGEDPLFPVTELLYNSPQCKGWCSAKFCEYPQEIILQFTHLVRVREIQILVHQNKIPSKIELQSFLPSGFQALQGELPLNKIKFEPLGYLEFDHNEKTKYTAREMKSAYLDSMAMLLKLLVYDHHPNKLNLFNQVSIIAINSLGDYYIPPTGLKEVLPIGGRFEEEMQYDPSTIEKLKQLFQAKKQAVAEGDYERAIKINAAIERLKAIGIKLNELVEKKRKALDKHDYNLAKKLKEEVDQLRMSVLSAKLQFEPTEQKPLQREWSRGQVQKITQSNQNVVFQRVPLTTETIMKDPKSFQVPQLDAEKVFTQEEINKIKAGGNLMESPSKKLDRSFRRQVGNQQPLTMQELVDKTQQQNPHIRIQDPMNLGGGNILNLEEQVIPTHLGGKNRGIDYVPEYDEAALQKTDRGASGQIEDLSEEDMKIAEPLIDVFGMDIVKKIFTSDWHYREQALNMIQEELSKGTKSEICGNIEQGRLFTTTFGVISNTVSDKIAQVCLSSLNLITKACKEIFPTVSLSVKSELNKNVDKTCTWMLDKIGDNNARVREKTEEAALAMAGHPAIGPQTIIQHVTKGQVKKSAINSVKHITGKLILLKKILGIYKVKNQNWEACIEYALNNIQHQNGDVRTCAYGVILELYIQLGKKIMDQFLNLRPQQMDILTRAFAEIDSGNVDKAFVIAGSTNVLSKQSTGVKQSVDLRKSQSSIKSKLSSLHASKTSISSSDNPQCQFCGLSNQEFEREEVLNMHYFEDCKFLTSCQYCDLINEIPNLRNHWLHECSKKSELRQCQRCKQVVPENIFEQHTIDQKCTPNKKDEPVCALCETNIHEINKKNLNEGWKIQTSTLSTIRPSLSNRQKKIWQFKLKRKHQITLKFCFKSGETAFGQYIKIVGNIPQLGNWNFQQGVSMRTNQILYPIWKASVSVPAINFSTSLVEYKYIITEAAQDDNKNEEEEVVRWEEIEGNRHLYLQRKPMTLRIFDEEGKREHLQVQEYQKFLCNVDQESFDDENFFLDDLSNFCITHSLRQYERFIIMKERNDSESFQSEDSVSGFSSFMRQNLSNIGTSSLNFAVRKRNSIGITSLSSDGVIEGLHNAVGAHLMISQDNEVGHLIDRQLNTNNNEDVGYVSDLENSGAAAAVCQSSNFERHHDERIKTLIEEDHENLKGLEGDQEHQINQEEMQDQREHELIAEDREFKGDRIYPEEDDDLIFCNSPRENIDQYQERQSNAQQKSQQNSKYSIFEEEEKEDKEKYKITKEDRLIVASLKLPIEAYKDENGQWKIRDGPNLLYPTLYRFREKKFVKLSWIGWSGHYPEDLESPEDIEEIKRLFKEQDCYPIFFQKRLLQQFIYYIQTIFYPLFHSFKGLNDSNDDLANQDYWKAYKEINILMSQEIMKARTSPKDLIWVNDLHLLLVPYYLREKDNQAHIGLFLHSAFPNSQIIQIFPQRTELMKSMLCCDLIGFHLFEYAKNFVTSCRKLLDLNYEFRRGGCLGIDVDGRYVSLRIGHVGIEKEYIDEVITSQEFTKCFSSLFSEKLSQKVLIAAVDYMHPMSGITNKLRGFYNFLSENSRWVSQVIFVQYVVPLKGGGENIMNHEMFKRFKQDIEMLTEKINSQFGKIVYLRNEGATKAQRCALWARADLLLITCFKDGLCLQPLEFLAVKQLLGKLSNAAIIISEFAGVSQALPGIHKVNPQNVIYQFLQSINQISEIKKKIEKVWSMSLQDKNDMIESALHYIEKHSTLKWAHSFLKDLKRSHEPTNLSYFMGATYNLNKRLMRENRDFIQIDEQMVQKIQASYSRCMNRLIIIDHEGTLPRKIGADPEPSPFVITILDQLTRDKRNTVFVVSPHSKRSMHQWFCTNAESVGLAAEDGFQYRFNSQFKNEYEWQKLIEIGNYHQEWMSIVEELMAHYVDKTDGAFIEKKESTIVFDFSDADNLFGHMIAKELGKHIDILISNGYPIMKVCGQSYLEVKPQELKKSLLLERIMKAISTKFKVDFILYIGDDSSNEEVFSYLNQAPKTAIKDYIYSSVNRECKVFTCTVGKKPTNAKYFLKDSHDMCNLLGILSNQSIKLKRNKSASDLGQAFNRRQSSKSRSGSRERKVLIGSGASQGQQNNSCYLKVSHKFESPTGSLNQKKGQYLLERIKVFRQNPSIYEAENE